MSRIYYLFLLMNSLYLLNEIMSNNLHSSFLGIISLLSILTGISVIISKNPIVSVLFLIGLFLTIAAYLMILGISFIGLSYLLVYVGAVSILFLFILMLINVRISELLSDTNKTIPLAIIVGITFNYIGESILPYSIYSGNSYDTSVLNQIYDLDYSHFIASSSWDSNIAENSHISSLGNIMYTNYFMWLLITSIILLLAMVGAIVITIK